MVSTKLRLRELLKARRWTTKVLAEKTSMSESYLTHIKNGTRRWNEDALKSMAEAFGLEPMDLLEDRNQASRTVRHNVSLPESFSTQKQLQVVPVTSRIPESPSPRNNRTAQLESGYQAQFVPLLDASDDSMFAYCVTDDSLDPIYLKGDLLIISPAELVRSGDIAAVEFGPNKTRAIKKVSYVEKTIILHAVNNAQPPIPLKRGVDHFRIIGKVVCRYQNF